MAKKIKKQKARTTPTRIFTLIIIPWIVMGAIAIVLYSAGAPDYVAIPGALGGSLLVTYFIRESMLPRKMKQ